MANKTTAALERLKEGWKEYQQFCLQFPDHNRNFRSRFEVSENHTHFMLTELQDFIKTEFEPQIAKLQALATDAYDSIKLPTIIGYSESEMLKCIGGFAEKPFSFGPDKQKLIQQILNKIDEFPATSERAFTEDERVKSISPVSPQACKDEVQNQMINF